MKNEQIELIPAWHENQDLNDAVNSQLAALMRLGHVTKEAIEKNPRGYVRAVCGALAGAVASMPAVQLAMREAHPGFDSVENYSEVVRAITKAFMIDSEALLAGELAPKKSRPQPGIPESLPPGPVN